MPFWSGVLRGNSIPESGPAGEGDTPEGGPARPAAPAAEDSALLSGLAGVRMPAPFAPADPPPAVDIAPFAGTYTREGVVITVGERDGTPHLVYEFVGGMKELSPPLVADLLPVSESVFAASGAGAFSEDWMPVVFSALPDGTGCAYIGMGCAPKTG
ncbi:hypothetical protein ACFO4E_13520 [Nocardiopsis mangrovi]|uniref:Uncharacterized protein n=1 Tax=Nocardiopsis mangrovi TaxID=1179818 RepID=A0ABV9DWW0_9ACTN